MRVLASPPEYARATRLRPWIFRAIPSPRRRTKASTWRDDADAQGREPRRESQDDPLAFAVRQVEQGPHVAVHAKGQFEDMGNEPRSVEGDGLLRVRHGLVTLQVVVRPVVDAADLLEPAEALLFHLDVEVDLVVKRALLLIELGKAKCVSRDPEPLEIESLNRREVGDGPGC